MPYYNPYIENLQAPFVSLHSLICQHTWIASPASVSTAFLPAHAAYRCMRSVLVHSHLPVHALQPGSLSSAGAYAPSWLTLICRRMHFLPVYPFVPLPSLHVSILCRKHRGHSCAVRKRLTKATAVPETLQIRETGTADSYRVFNRLFNSWTVPAIQSAPASVSS